DFVVIARSGVEQLDYHGMKKNLLHVLKLAAIYQEGREGEKKR
ncbi:ribonuclease P protein component, partial [Streptococcus suis]